MALKPCTICRLSRYAVAYAKTKANWHPANHSGFSSGGLTRAPSTNLASRKLYHTQGVHNCKKEPSASQVSGLGATYNFSFASQPILKVSSKASGFGFFDSPRIAANKSLPKGYPSFAAKPVSQKHEVVREAEKKQDCKARPRPAPLPLLEFASLGTQGKGASQPTADLRIAPSTKAWKLYSGVVNKQQKKKTQKDSKGKQDALLAFARMSM